MAESRNVVRKKTEVEVLPVVDLSAESPFFSFLWAMQHRWTQDVRNPIFFA